MSEPLGGPAPVAGEAVVSFQTKRFEWRDEAVTTYCEVLVYYDTARQRATRATLENTSTLHTGILVVYGKQETEIFRQVVNAPHPLQQWDLSGFNLIVRDGEGGGNTDRFSFSLGMMG